MIIPDLLSWICLLAGSFFCIVGGIGLVRLPDFYSRMHGSGITDTLGAGLVLVGLMIQGGLTLVTVKLIMILVLLLLTSPTATHAIAKAAFTAGVEPQLDQEEDAQ
jgi:multicomponent Na+:H+ antiporter subunit G